MFTRRSFLASLAATFVLGRARSASPSKPRPAELVNADTTGEPFAGVDPYDSVDAFAYAVNPRRMPPGVEFYYDPKVMRRLQLSDERDAARHMARLVEDFRNVRISRFDQ